MMICKLILKDYMLVEMLQEDYFKFVRQYMKQGIKKPRNRKTPGLVIFCAYTASSPFSTRYSWFGNMMPTDSGRRSLSGLPETRLADSVRP